jgi:hypothetical protein
MERIDRGIDARTTARDLGAGAMTSARVAVAAAIADRRDLARAARDRAARHQRDERPQGIVCSNEPETA